MGFFLDTLPLSSWNVALYIIIGYMAIVTVSYFATFYLKWKRRIMKSADEIDVEIEDDNSWISIKSTRSSTSKSVKTAISQMAKTQRDDKSLRSFSSSNSKSLGGGNGLLEVKHTKLSARFSDGKSPILPDNVLPKVKMPREHYFEKIIDDITQELTKSIREGSQRSPPVETATSKPRISEDASNRDDSESTHTQTASETSYSEGSGGGEETSGGSGDGAIPTSSEDEEKDKRSEDEGGDDEDSSDKNEMKEDETTTKTTTSNDKTSTTMPEDGSETSSGGEH